MTWTDFLASLIHPSRDAWCRGSDDGLDRGDTGVRGAALTAEGEVCGQVLMTDGRRLADDRQREKMASRQQVWEVEWMGISLRQRLEEERRVILEQQFGLRWFCFSWSTVLTADSNSRGLRWVGNDVGWLIQTGTAVRTESLWACPP